LPYSAKTLYNLAAYDAEDMDFEQLAVKWKVTGTSTAIEKSYLRLTEQPDPSTVRPEPILKEAMDHLLKKWKEGRCEYNFISD
jgi:hypothetical protein